MIPVLHNGLGEWLSASCSERRARSRWGACIDVCSPGDACKARSVSEFRDMDILIDDRGLHVVRDSNADAGSGYAHLHVSAKEASKWASQSDNLSEALTSPDQNTADASERQLFLQSVSNPPWCSQDRTGCGLPGLGVHWFDMKMIPKSCSFSTNSMPCKSPQSEKSSSRLGVAGAKAVKFADIRKIAVMGKGSTAAVWKCEDATSRSALAVKQLSPDSDTRRLRRVMRELVLMHGVEHVGIVSCYNVFYASNSFHMVMELMDGGSLLDAMKRCSASGSPYTMDPMALAAIAADALHALEFLHDALKIIHRDIKPGNILLTTRGKAKLGDLGIATLPGVVQVDPCRGASQACDGSPAAIEWIGTMTYMSPERLSGNRYSFNADIWSLGLVLLEAALGRYPLLQDMEGAASSSLDFWDFFDVIMHGPCPSEVLKMSPRFGSEWESLRAVASACLAKDASKRPCARDLLLCTLGDSGAEVGTPLLEWTNAHNGSPELAAWVQMTLQNDREAMQLQGLVDHCGSEADGWL